MFLYHLQKFNFRDWRPTNCIVVVVVVVTVVVVVDEVVLAAVVDFF